MARSVCKQGISFSRPVTFGWNMSWSYISTRRNCVEGSCSHTPNQIENQATLTFKHDINVGTCLLQGSTCTAEGEAIGLHTCTSTCLVSFQVGVSVFFLMDVFSRDSGCVDSSTKGSLLPSTSYFFRPRASTTSTVSRPTCLRLQHRVSRPNLPDISATAVLFAEPCASAMSIHKPAM